MYYRLFRKLYEREAIRMCRKCRDFIRDGQRILDLGCGAGIVGKTFQEFFRAELLGVDIVDRRVVDIPFKLSGSSSLPLKDNSFDLVLISYVLHHTGKPKVLLGEAKRVSRDKIIVFEDIPDRWISGIFCRFHGFSFDKLFRNPTKTTFYSEREWKEVFKQLGLNLLFSQRVNNFPVKKELFVLGV
ncbi:MAG TPA: class I SAM-dependent methyltransferase [bacterium]|nr:class I SAM-dependent methyltransferase [bacterium]